MEQCLTWGCPCDSSLKEAFFGLAPLRAVFLLEQGHYRLYEGTIPQVLQRGPIFSELSPCVPGDPLLHQLC